MAAAAATMLHAAQGRTLGRDKRGTMALCCTNQWRINGRKTAAIMRQDVGHRTATRRDHRTDSGTSPAQRLRMAGRHWPAAVSSSSRNQARPARWFVARDARCCVRMTFRQLPCWRLGAWLRPVSRGNRHFTVGGGRLRQSGPRPKGRLLRQPALEGLTRSARTETPRKVGRNNFRRGAAA
ncbi:hypothetical protein F511_20449 [Dorcoceras hygrometricum]|uniref:Uncharacterized protein n=1 Tax=Dorcoceras hygrometricum TaxID=472368 RepID=A0A2Z7ADJ4_9LAMI|nr:hypothetical protein F511_20449 [Dorcoceras hygrometricum]